MLKCNPAVSTGFSMTVILILHMKFALPIILCCFGFFFAGVGYLFRIMHWPMGTLIMAGGGLILLTGVVVLVVMLSRGKGQDRG